MKKLVAGFWIVVLACPMALAQAPAGEEKMPPPQPPPPAEMPLPGEVLVPATSSSDSPASVQPTDNMQPGETVVPAGEPGNIQPGETIVPVGDSGTFDGGTGATRFWAGLEYMLFWIKDGGAPSLVTANAHGAPAALGTPGTVVLFSGNFDYNTFSGGRLSGGWWFNQEGTWGLEGNLFMLEHRTNQFSAGASAAGTTELARPFFNPVTLMQDRQFIASPGLYSGRFEASTGTRLWGSEASIAFRPDPTSDWKFLLGFRYLDLNENLAMWQQTTILPGTADVVLLSNPAVFAAGGVFGPAVERFTDAFLARNQFYGAQLGAQRSFDFGPVSLFLSAKIALGSTHEVVDTAGFKTVVSPALGTISGKGGFLTEVTNVGRRTENSFSAIPDLEARVHYQVLQHVNVFAGYNFLYWGNVVRPGDQIDFAVNPVIRATDRVIGPPRPASQFNQSDFWAQGVTFGILFQY